MSGRPIQIFYPGGRIGPVRYRKKVVVNKKEVDGYSRVEERIILIRSGASARRQAEILLHELVHMALDPVKLEPPLGAGDIEEVIVDTLGENLAQLWRDNPAVFQWIAVGLTLNET